MDRFNDCVVAVTGGASGIGLATALAFAKESASVYVLDLNSSQSLGDLNVITTDITDRSSIATAMNEIERLSGRLDILINNAGVSAIGTVEENTDEEWQKVLNVNVIGMARVSALALPLLRRSKNAAIINLCSIGALNGLPQRALYNASKGAVLSLTFAMATDHVREGIRVNCVSPGTVMTPFVERMLQGFADPVAERAALNARQATGRMVTPEEVAGAILYLADPTSSSTTGTNLEVDGGVHNLRFRQLPEPQSTTGKVTA